MAEQAEAVKILGVDFSGDQRRNSTHATKGVLRGNILELESCEAMPKTLPAAHDELKGLIQGLTGDAVVALDFPFSVPIAFAEYLGYSEREMPGLWQLAASKGWDAFIAKRNDFVKDHEEYLRVGDLHIPGAYPCLHDTNPNMVRMTFHGMEMLNSLWSETDCQVPPLKYPERKGTVLMEVMPGAALQVFDLPYKGYKGKGPKTSAKQQERREKRKEILEKLSCVSGIRLENHEQISDYCLENQGGDALDSLVAAILAARWAKNKSDFLVPTSDVVDTLKRKKKHKLQACRQALGRKKIDVARLEGWIYNLKS